MKDHKHNKQHIQVFLSVAIATLKAEIKANNLNINEAVNNQTRAQLEKFNSILVDLLRELKTFNKSLTFNYCTTSFNFVHALFDNKVRINPYYKANFKYVYNRINNAYKEVV